MKKLLSVITGLLLVGCVEYKAGPIDWQAEAAALEESAQSVSWTLEDVQVRAVAFSPELNALRLKHATSEAKAAASGYWDDPSLDIDVLRVLKEPKNPWTYGGALSLTLPVTGIPGLERRAAEAYAKADRWDIVAAEYATVSEATALAQNAMALRRLIAFLDQDRRNEQYRAARQVSERLVEAGEMTRTELVQQAAADQELDHTIFELRNERLAAETKLRRLTGLPPTCAFDWQAEDVLPELTTNEVTLLDFVRAPEVRAACARHEGKELDLEKEIRRQYPELSLGPAYTREDGFDKVGFKLGLTLPLWNRNRLGIAEANGARDESRAAAVTAWLDVARRYAEAVQALALTGDWEIKSARAEADALYEAGELTAGEYVAVRQQDWTQVVNAHRRRMAACEAIFKINTLVESLSEEEVTEE